MTSGKVCDSSNGRLAVLIVFYVFYLFFGAFVFDSLESPHEQIIIRELNNYVKQFRQQHNSCLTDEELNEFIKVISQANDKGVPATGNVSKEPNWSFGQAVFFSGTVLTTIGYGDVSPQTPTGKVFCILFALIGIPVTLLLLYSIIERLMCVTSCLLEHFIEKMQPTFNKLGLFNYSLQRSHMHIAFALLCTLFVLVFFLILPAIVYSHIENWSFLNAFYYCFISLSTVGLGDYVPGDSTEQKNRHLYKIFSTLYLIVGVTSMVWLLQIFSETSEFNLYKYFSLSKDAILTSHRDTIHNIASPSSLATVPADHQTATHPTKHASHQKQYYDLNQPSQESNDDELILNNASQNNNSQNYLSLNELNNSSSNNNNNNISTTNQ